MKTVQEYLRHADECDALARKATIPEIREQIVQMARTWRMLAEERRQKIAKLGPLPANDAAVASASVANPASNLEALYRKK